METGRDAKASDGGVKRDPPGIVILNGQRPERTPVIAAFIWGWKVRPVPTLPFGRWKMAG
jgi:hypothetical protein